MLSFVVWRSLLVVWRLAFGVCSLFGSSLRVACCLWFVVCLLLVRWLLCMFAGAVSRRFVLFVVCVLLRARCLLFVVPYIVSVCWFACCWLLVGVFCLLLSVVCNLLIGVCCLVVLVFHCCSLFVVCVAYCQLLVVRCLLSAALLLLYCRLFVVCCCLLVVCSVLLFGVR